MIKHVVMWKLKDHAEGAGKAANAQKMKAMLESCAGIVPGMLKLEVALPQAGLEATCDIMLYTVFDSKAALDAYQEHPKHVAIKPFIGAIREARECVDYEI